MVELFKTVSEQCGTTHNMTALSITSAVVSGIFMIFTIPLNSVIIYCILKERKRKYKGFFYKLILNIAIADFLTGLIVEPASVNLLWKEALRIQLTKFEIYIDHVPLFFTDAISLITLTILSIDRMFILLMPIKHYKGLKPKTENIIVLVSWPVAFLLVIPYFKINFIKQLAVFTAVNIILCILSLISTTITYKRYSTNIYKQENNTKHKQTSESSEETTQDHNKPSMQDIQENTRTELQLNLTILKPRSVTIISQRSQERKQSANVNAFQTIQKKATRTFIIMLCVFIGTYLPTCFTMIYMNACTDCDCVVIHVMRDVSIRSILASSIFRPLNFILTLRHLRSSVRKLFRK